MEQNAKAYPKMAGFLERFLALLVDSIIISIFTSQIAFATGFFNTSTEIIFNGGKSVDPVFFTATMMGASLVWIINIAISLGVAYFYFGWFYANKGQTPGKMLVKIKVLKEDLTHLTMTEAFIRDGLMKQLSGLLMCLGYFWYFKNQKRQTWHDLVVKSYVVKTDDNGNVIMDGLERYPSSNVKAFGCPIGCCLLQILVIAGVVISFGMMLESIAEQGKTDKSNKMQEKMFKGSDHQFESEYNQKEGSFKYKDQNGQEFNFKFNEPESVKPVKLSL